jgi:hypothetical protein
MVRGALAPLDVRDDALQARASAVVVDEWVIASFAVSESSDAPDLGAFCLEVLRRPGEEQLVPASVVGVSICPLVRLLPSGLRIDEAGPRRLGVLQQVERSGHLFRSPARSRAPTMSRSRCRVAW